MKIDMIDKFMSLIIRLETLEENTRPKRQKAVIERFLFSKHLKQLPGNLSRKGFVPIRGSPRRVTEDVHIFVVVYCWRPSYADPHTALSR
jgi:hypothetical protein